MTSSRLWKLNLANRKHKLIMYIFAIFSFQWESYGWAACVWFIKKNRVIRESFTTGSQESFVQESNAMVWDVSSRWRLLTEAVSAEQVLRTAKNSIYSYVNTLHSCLRAFPESFFREPETLSRLNGGFGDVWVLKLWLLWPSTAHKQNILHEETDSSHRDSTHSVMTNGLCTEKAGSSR